MQQLLQQSGLHKAEDSPTLCEACNLTHLLCGLTHNHMSCPACELLLLTRLHAPKPLLMLVCSHC
jgi:hypothetical protein